MGDSGVLALPSQSYVKPFSIANESDGAVTGVRHLHQPDSELSAFPVGAATIHTSVWVFDPLK